MFGTVVYVPIYLLTAIGFSCHIKGSTLKWFIDRYTSIKKGILNLECVYISTEESGSELIITVESREQLPGFSEFYPIIEFDVDRLYIDYYSCNVFGEKL